MSDPKSYHPEVLDAMHASAEKCGISLSDIQVEALLKAHDCSRDSTPADTPSNTSAALFGFLAQAKIALVAHSTMSTLRLPNQAPHWVGGLSIENRRIEVSLENVVNLIHDDGGHLVLAGLIHEASHILAASLVEGEVGVVDAYIAARLFGADHPVSARVQADLHESQGTEKAAAACWKFACLVAAHWSSR